MKEDEGILPRVLPAKIEVFAGIDLGSTTTKAVLLDTDGKLLGRGITNSRSNYHVAADVARAEAFASARFVLLERSLAELLPPSRARGVREALRERFRQEQFLAQLEALRQEALAVAGERARKRHHPMLQSRLEELFDEARERFLDPLAVVQKRKSHFFRDEAGALYTAIAERLASPELGFETLMAVFDKAILRVENRPPAAGFREAIEAALRGLEARLEPAESGVVRQVVRRLSELEICVRRSIGTGYGRQTLPFPKEEIRSEILCHGLGAHHLFPRTATVLDIGGQDTKAIQVDEEGIVISFQMNDRCAAGCGRYLGYIADEMSLGLHELGPLALRSCHPVKITSTCTVFAGAELRERLSLGQKREDILAGLHRAIILRAMALLARSGGVREEFTFTGGVANNPAAVRALRELVEENYGHRTVNISPDSIYIGALGAALFAQRERRTAAAAA